MADGFGSIDNPVPLDPFTWLTEVHWAGTFLMVSFGMKVTSVADGEFGIGPGPAFVEPFSEAYTSLATPAYNPEQPKVSASAGDGFVDIGSDEVTLSGIPDVPSPTSFDNWKVNGLSSGGSRQPFIRFLPPTGGHPDIKLPSKNTWFTNLTGEGELVAQEFISEPEPLPVGGEVPLWATFNPTPSQQNTFSLAMAGLSATYKDRTYQPIAIRVFDQNDLNTGQLQVLLKRQPAA